MPFLLVFGPTKKPHDSRGVVRRHCLGGHLRRCAPVAYVSGSGRREQPDEGPDRPLVLYRPEAFERLNDTRWSERRVRAGIAAIVADAEQGLRGPKLLWPADPWDRWHGTSPMKNLYVGTSGSCGRCTSCVASPIRDSTSVSSRSRTSSCSERGPTS